MQERSIALSQQGQHSVRFLCIQQPQDSREAAQPRRLPRCGFPFLNEWKTQDQESRRCVQLSWDPGWPAMHDSPTVVSLCFFLVETGECWLAGPAQRSALIAQREGSVSLSPRHKCCLWDINLSIIWEVPSGFTDKRARHLEVTLGL